MPIQVSVVAIQRDDVFDPVSITDVLKADMRSSTAVPRVFNVTTEVSMSARARGSRRLPNHPSNPCVLHWQNAALAPVELALMETSNHSPAPPILAHWLRC